MTDIGSNLLNIDVDNSRIFKIDHGVITQQQQFLFNWIIQAYKPFKTTI